MNIACPECSTLYRVDPDRVPEGGTTTRCRECGTAFLIDDTLDPLPAGEFATAQRAEPAAAGVGEAPRGEAPRGGTPEAGEPEAGEPEVGEPEVAEAQPAESRVAPEAVEAPEEAGSSEPSEEPSEAPVFGPQDPKTRARRLARALVSDIKVYHPDKWEESTRAGTLRADFRDEIMKSWEEYVEQVGEDMAKKTPYFRDALNEILAQGDSVF